MGPNSLMVVYVDPLGSAHMCLTGACELGIVAIQTKIHDLARPHIRETFIPNPQAK